MYIVMDPEDEYCPGYFGVVVTPPLKPMKSGEARNLRFYYLNWLCASSDDCIDETYDYCFESFNFCVDKGTDPDCPPGGSGSCGETQMDCKCTEEDYVCMEEEGIPRCIKSPPSVYVDRLVCSCYDNFCISEPKKIYNCCDSDFTKGYHENVPDIAEIELNAYNPQGFCPEYDVSENDICQYYIDPTSSGKHNIKDMSDVKYYGTEFKVIYKFSGSTIFHSQVGKLGVTNSGSI